MPRNAEVIRQWKLLLHLDGLAHGRAVDELAAELGVNKRTVWRDLAALQEAGFPLVDDKRDRKTVWRVMQLPLKSLTDAGLSVTEVCSLYMSRALLLTLTGSPFEAGLNSLLKKVQRALSPKSRQFLDELPNVVRVRPEPRKKVSAGYNEMVAQADRGLDSSQGRRDALLLGQQQPAEGLRRPPVRRASTPTAACTCAPTCPSTTRCGCSRSSGSRRSGSRSESFTPVKAVSDEDFEPSLGLGNGKPERIVLEFSARVAPYVRERVWHKSQQIDELRRWRPAAQAEGLPRLGAARLGPQLGPARARHRPVDARPRDPRHAGRCPGVLRAEAEVRAGVHSGRFFRRAVPPASRECATR